MRLEDYCVFKTSLNYEYQASLGYAVRMWAPVSQNSWLGMVVRACNPGTWEVEAGGSGVQGQPVPQETKKPK